MRRRLAGAGRVSGAAAAVWLALSPVTAAPPVTFSDATGGAGIDFTQTTGAFGEKYLPETLGGGAVWLDADGDGWQDLFLVNSTNWPGRGAATPSAFYRNDADGTFTEATAAAGLDEPIYGIGGAAADYDNDGDIDLYITALGPNRLYRNRGDGTFEDATGPAGVGDPGFSTSAIWWDYNADGDIDLFVANYVEWSAETDLFCTLDGSTKSYCTPESYTGQSGTLYRNRGDGAFEDVTVAAGLSTPTAKGLGVAMLDADGDGAMDLFVANDTEPDQLFRNRGDGAFEDIGVVAGVAYSETGVARAGMGVDAADYDDSGRPSLVIGHFSNEMMALFHNEGGLFLDEAPRSALGRATLLTLTFGCFFFDADLDGRLDIFAANGHVADDVERLQSRVTHAQAPQLFRNTGGGRFEEVTDGGDTLAAPMVGRGAAYADYDRDGDLDIIVTANGGPARLLRNDLGAAPNLIRLTLRGTGANRSGIGAQVEVAAGGETRRRVVKSGSSYASQSELPVTVGLGVAARADSVRVVWPGGAVDDLGTVEANREIVIEQGTGVVETSPIERRNQ